MSGIDAAITDHFVMLSRDMLDKMLYKFHNWDSFFNIVVIFKAVVMESIKVTILVANTGSGDYRPSGIAPNYFRPVCGSHLLGLA